MSNRGFKPGSPLFSSNNAYQSLAQQRPTRPSHENLGDAFMQSKLGRPYLARDLAIREHFSNATQIERKALVLLNDTARPAKEIIQDAARYIKAARQETKTSVDAAGELSSDIDPILASTQNHKWLIPVADETVVEIPDYLQDQRAEILDTAAALNDFHQDVNQKARDSYFQKANLYLQKIYPKLIERLEELKRLSTNSDLEVLIEYLEERTKGWQNPNEVSQLESSYRHDGLDDMIIRSALYYGLPNDLAVQLARNFVNTDLVDPFSRIPVIDIKEGHSVLGAAASTDSQIDDLKPSYDLFGNSAPLNIIDAVRMAMLENAPEMNLRDPGSTFYRSLSNLNDAQEIHYNEGNIDPRIREPHFMGSGAWAELRAGMAMIKLQAQHEKLITTRDHDKSKEPRLVVGVTPCLNKKFFDNAGVDYWIKTVRATEIKPIFEYIPIQIKSSQIGVDDYYKKGNQNLAISIKADPKSGPARGKTLSKIADEVRAEVANPGVLVSEENYIRLNQELENNQERKTASQRNSFRKARNLLIDIIKGRRPGTQRIT